MMSFDNTSATSRCIPNGTDKDGQLFKSGPYDTGGETVQK